MNNITIVPLPPLGIDKTSVLTAGCSNTADFSHQFHVAFSSIVTGSCIFSGMPVRLLANVLASHTHARAHTLFYRSEHVHLAQN